jgi:UDP-3-O-[3-hydroxymyristoyl] N-acetylglucosamine deacetylase
MERPIKTLAAGVTIAGIGLHTGRHAEVRLRPAPPGRGFVFERVDLDGHPMVPARPDLVADTTRATTLAKGDASVQTVEHLVAALFGMGVSDAHIEVAGPEIPILDGSAAPFVEAIARAGTTTHGKRPPRQALDAPIWMPSGDSFLAAIPSPELRFSYGIVFEASPIGEQWQSFVLDANRFRDELAPARTFARLAEVEALRERGLVAGGSLDVALVCDETKWLNGPLRFPNEPVRHKLLDFIGDLGLLGDELPCAHYIAFRAGHALHVKLAKRIVYGA